MAKKEIKLPKWFDGQVYPEGGDVTNPYTGECYTLSNIELSMYDLILGAERLRVYDIMQKGLAWFRTANPEAYMGLLD
jgi:hypothetical protein